MKFKLSWVFLAVSLSMASGQEEIRSNEAYIEAIGRVIEDYTGGTAYLGTEFTWKLLTEKADRMLAIEEGVDPDAVSEELRNVVFMSNTLDLVALAMADNRTNPISRKKLTPIEKLPEFYKRIQATTISVAKDQNVQDLANQVIRSGPINSLKNYEKLRGMTGTHDGWKQFLTHLSASDPRIEKFLNNPTLTSPFWQYHNVAMGIPAVSDTPKNYWKEVTEASPVNLGSIFDGPFTITMEEESGTFERQYVIIHDDNRPLHVTATATEGAILVQSESSVILARKGKPESLTGDRFSRPYNPGREKVIITVRRTKIENSPKFTEPSSAIVHVWGGSKSP